MLTQDFIAFFFFLFFLTGSKLDTTQISLDKGTDKQTVANAHAGVLLSNEKE